jgi:hypothetical protein
MRNFSKPLPTNIVSSLDTFAADMNKIVEVLAELRSNIPASAADVNAVSLSDYSTLLGRVVALETALAKLENPATGVVPPSAPTITSVTPGDTTVTVAFTAPAVTGGADITKYILKSSTGKTVEGTSSPITMTGLTNGTSVTFTLSAVNSAGTGTSSASSASVTPNNITKPTAPTNVNVTNSDGSVTVSWATPSSDGGSAITGYRITQDSTKTVDVSANARSQGFSGLTNGQTYTFTVAAINSNGAGPTVTVTGKPAASSIPSSALTAPSSAFATTGIWQTGGVGEIYTGQVGATATLTFTGTYVELSAVIDAHHTSMSVQVDSGAVVTISEQSTVRNENAVVYALAGLSSGTHTIKVTVLSASSPTITILKARVAAYASSNPDPGPVVVQPISGFVQRNTSSTGLLLNGKPYKYVGYNFVNAPYGATNDQRRITDQAAYFKNYAAGMTERVWFLPGSNMSQFDTTVAEAKKNGTRLLVTIFDALGAKGPKWDVIKSNFSTYKPHLETLVGRYKDDPTIMGWEIANEPPQDRAGFDMIGAAIKAVDPNHLVCTGTLAVYSDSGVPAFQNAGASPYVDILSMHEYDSLQTVSSHLARILPAADALKKPIIIGEFGIDASPSGNGTGGTAPGNGHTSWAGRATLIGQKADGYLGKSQVCGINYWSIGQNHLGDTILDSYMPLQDTQGTAAMRAASAKWSKNGN